MVSETFIDGVIRKSEEFDAKGDETMAHLFRCIAIQNLIIKRQLADHEVLTKKVIWMQGSILAMINGAEVVQKLLINIARQMPEHSREVDIVKGKLAEYEPILKEVYNQIDIESKGQQGNQERHKNLGGTYS